MKTLRLLAVLAAAFAGGAFANWMLYAVPALAQEEPAGPEKPAIATTVEAQSFVLKDKDGNVRATLALDENGQPGLRLKDAVGLERAKFALVKRADEKINGALHLASDSGKSSALLVGFAEGEASLDLYDSIAKPRVSLDVNADKSATINVSSADGTRNISLASFENAPGEHKAKWETKKETREKPEGEEAKPNAEAPVAKGPTMSLRLFSNGTADMLITDKEGSQRVNLGVYDAGVTGMLVMDKEERPVLLQGLWADGTRGQDIYYANGKLACYTGVDEGGNIGMTMKDTEGKFGLSTIVDRKNATGFRVYGPDETLRAQLMLNATNGSQLDLYDKNAKLRALLGSFEDCTQMQLKDKDGVTRLLNSYWEDGDTASTLYAGASKPRISMEVRGDDSEMRIWDTENIQRGTLGWVRRQARLGLYDKKVQFRAGSWLDDAANAAFSTLRNSSNNSVWEQTGK